MSVIRVDQAVVHQMHGSTFSSYVAPASGSQQLCAWRVAVAPGLKGQPPVVSHEEVFLVLAGRPTLTIDGRSTGLEPGDVALAPAGASLCLDNTTNENATLWVSTSVGLEAVMADGARVSPPWVR